MKNHDQHLADCRRLAKLAVAAGSIGMSMSFQFLGSASFEDITAGMSGFVAGAILVGAGVMSIALLARPAMLQKSLTPE